MSMWKPKLFRRRSVPTVPVGCMRPAAHVSVARGEGRTVILDTNTSRYWGLDDVGSTIWACIEDGCDAAAVHDRLAECYDAPRTQLIADADAFLARLVAARLVVPA